MDMNGVTLPPRFGGSAMKQVTMTLAALCHSVSRETDECDY